MLAEKTRRKVVLTFTANSQINLMETHDIKVKSGCQSIPGTIDNVSTEILKLYQPALLERMVLIYVVGDGNCLYRAVSRALCGDEHQHGILRLKTILEIISNRKHYDTSMSIQLDHVNLISAFQFTRDGLECPD